MNEPFIYFPFEMPKNKENKKSMKEALSPLSYFLFSLFFFSGGPFFFLFSIFQNLLFSPYSSRPRSQPPELIFLSPLIESKEVSSLASMALISESPGKLTSRQVNDRLDADGDVLKQLVFGHEPLSTTWRHWNKPRTVGHTHERPHGCGRRCMALL